MSYFFQQSLFIIRFRYIKRSIGYLRKKYYTLYGMKIGTSTFLPEIYINWPHQVTIGNQCTLEHNIFLKYDGVWKKEPSIFIGDAVFIGAGCEFNIREGISIGNNTLIASGCKFIDHDHGISRSELMNAQSGIEKPIKIGDDVWLGCNVIVLKGVEIGKGAIVAAGAVITKSIGDYEIWAGVPAKKIGDRK